MASEVLTVQAVARELLISRAHAYDLVSKGVIPSVRIGPRSIRVLRSSLDRFLLERERAPISV